MDRSVCICRGLIVIAAFFWNAPIAAAVDLGQRYPATLEPGDTSRGYDWTCDKEDVWRLTEFRFALDDQYSIALGPSQAVFGHHGSDVLWAAVFPDEPGELLVAADGQGEHVTSVWLRFNPARLGELFPNGTVSGQGDPAMLLDARRLAAHKMRCCWQSGGRPMIPWKNSVTIDVETREGARRFHSIDTDAKTVQYVDAFRTRPLPSPVPVDRKTALEAFDEVWGAFDREYAMFVVKPDVDWAALREEYRPRAAAVENDYQLAAVLAEMLAHLEDLHVYVKVGGEYVPGYNRQRPLNGSVAAVSHLVGTPANTGHDLMWARTDDGVGYINVYRLADPQLPAAFDDALAKMAGTKGLILDLRFNGGGSEPLGQQIAGRLLDRERVYSLSQYRNGPKHTDLGPKHERTCGPSGPWHHSGPVIVLVGQRTMSSAESFALMLAQCPQVTTMGDRTAGSSGNPRQLQVAGNIVVNLPRWLDMDPDGKPIDAVGIPPDMRIEAKPDEFTEKSDPVLEAALKDLRSRPQRKDSAVLTHRDGASAPSAGAEHRAKRAPWSPQQATGEPDTQNAGDCPTAWASATPDRQQEWLMLEYAEPVVPKRIEIHETFNPGAVSRVTVFDGDGKEVEAFSGEDPTPTDSGQGVSKIAVNVDFKTAKVRIYLDSVHVKGWNEIDAVALVDAAGQKQWAAKASASSTFGQFPEPRVEEDNVDRPKVVAVSPPDGATDVDPITEIRVQFDRPMDPRSALLNWDSADGPGFRLRGDMRYDAGRNEFILPLTLTPGANHLIKLNRRLGLRLEGFRSTEGVVARSHEWQFTTRTTSAVPGAAQPRLVSVDPPSGSKTSVFTSIRLVFDRPMSPDRYEVVDATTRKPGEMGLSVRFPVRYDAESNAFTIPLLLPPDKTCRIELDELWSGEGGQAEPVQLEYEVTGKLYTAAQESRIAAAARSEKLHEVVDAVRRARLAVTSLEEEVQSIQTVGVRSAWATTFCSNGSTFRFQGERQFLADVSDIMQTPFVVGSDGRQCWNRCGEELVACPFDAVDEKNVLFCDPFGSTRFRSADEAIDALNLEYLGREELDGRTCYRVRSWKGDISRFDKSSFWWVNGLVDWLIDAETHLPVVVEQGGFRTRYSYSRINEPMAEADFQPTPAGESAAKEPEPLGKGFDRRFLNARDGSDGRMTVRWGQKNSRGGRSSSGLN